MSADVTIKFANDGPRRCSGCTLCCKLIPVKEVNKPAGERCKHQKHTGCAVYRKAGFPMSCHYWSCRWLVNDDTADLRRPDRSRYVIDIMPDFVTLKPDDGSEPYNVPVVQIWCDPNAPEAWRDPALLRYLDRRGEDGTAALIRFDNKRGITVFPPSMTGDTWREYHNGTLRAEHTLAEKVAAISTAPKIVPKQ
jgi:hypothetical protein